MLRLLPSLLAVLALLGSGPLHEWLHHGDPVVLQDVELHGEDCDHFPGSAEHDDDCSLCVAARVAVIAPGAASSARTLTLPPDARPMVRTDVAPRPWSSRVQGARAPPLKG